MLLWTPTSRDQNKLLLPTPSQPTASAKHKEVCLPTFSPQMGPTGRPSGSLCCQVTESLSQLGSLWLELQCLQLLHWLLLYPPGTSSLPGPCSLGKWVTLVECASAEPPAPPFPETKQ
ncbi:hypothetical protein H8959_020134 [Pygathrix nigripes]